MNERASRCKPRPRAVRGTLLGASICLAGCTMGPDFVRPMPPAQTHFTPSDPVAVGSQPGADAQALVPGLAPAPQWWQAFGSPALNALVVQALAASPSLDSALAAVAQADALVVAARASTFPQVSVAVSAARARRASSEAGAANQFSLGPAVVLDTDAFGAARRRAEQAQALAEYQWAQWQGARLGLVGNVVLQAITLAAVSAQVAAVREIIDVDQRNLELVQVSAEVGKSAQLDVLTAASQLANDRTLLPPLEQQGSVARHALAVLAGRTSVNWAPPPFDLAMLVLPRELPLSLPSQVVRRHPEIRSAEAQLHAANAAIGIATAQLYPNVTLSANWAATAATSGGLLAGGSHVWNLAANLLAPVFNGGALAAQRTAAVAAYAGQLGNYRQAMLLVFGRIADALEALPHDAALLSAQGKALETARAALVLTQESYHAGQASLLQLLESQRLFQQARLGYARALGQRFSNTAQLFIALGSAVDGPAPGEDQRR